MHLTRRQILGLAIGGVAAGLFKSLEASPQATIIKRAIPSSGELIPVIGMGTWLTFDVGNSESSRMPLREVLKMFGSKGGKLIDSSPMYGNSERVVGDLARELGITKELFFATKIWTSGESEGKEQVRNSLDRFGVKTINLLQVHNLLDYSVHYKTIRKLKDDGKVRYIGITHYLEGAYPQIEEIIKRDPIDFVQFNFSLSSREAENRLLPIAAERNVAVITNRPFNGGNIFESVRGKTLPEWSREFDCSSWAQFFLKYIISNPSLTCTIPATRNPKHMEDNLQAAFGKLPDEATRRRMVKHFLSI